MFADEDAEGDYADIEVTELTDRLAEGRQALAASRHSDWNSDEELTAAAKKAFETSVGRWHRRRGSTEQVCVRPCGVICFRQSLLDSEGIRSVVVSVTRYLSLVPVV